MQSSIAGSRTPFRRTAFALAILAVAGCAAYAGTTGKIAGKVVDAQTKEALVGVNLVVVGTSLGAASDIEGNYFIINIPPGTVELKVSALGYSAASFKGIRVSVDQTSRLDVELQPQAIEVNEVVVTASRPIVQRDLTSTIATVSHEELAALPVETISSAVNLQAGVVEGHFRGGRSNEVKYLVDGISVNDVFSGESQLEPEINSVQEVQVLSGTFNAEYGEALSGIVNQVTKIGSDKYTGQITGYFGDYISSKTDLYEHIDHVSPKDITNIEASLSGPVPGIESFMKFFISGRSYYNDGYIYGQRIFNPSDSSNFSANDPSQWHVGNTGDGEYVSFNSEKRWSLQSKLSLNFTPTHVVNLNGLYQQRDYRQYNHLYKLDPDGDYKYFQKSFLGTASYNHVINDAAFIDARGSVFISDYKQYTYKNPVDANGNIIVSPDYVTPTRQSDVGANAFYAGGTENWNFSHHTVTSSGKLDFTDQISTLHQIKTGVDLQFHTLRYEDYQVHVEPPSYIPSLPVYGSFDFNTYKNHPYQLAGYLQDKIELDYLVVNIGLRYDYFQPDGYALKDPDNIAQLDTLIPPYPSELLNKATPKHQFSPRIGLSYPITDKGAIHISYGHFFQIPAFQYLYNNPNYRIPLNGTFPDFVGGTIGNPDLEPQQTIMYEIGLQQEIAPNLGITVTGYYKDIRNLLGVEIHYKLNSKNFGMYINRDYGAVKGFTLALERRMSDNYGFTVDYTFQIAQGNASDPLADYNKAQANPPIPINKELVPLDWDRRHSLNLTFTYGKADNYAASLVMRLGSGLPYTPAVQNQRTGLENSESKPTYYNTDIIFTKYLSMFELPVSLYVKIYNVFDTANELNVYTDTGRAGTTLALNRPQEPPRGVNTLAEFYNRPDFYSAPRQILIGASLSF
jgi:outer membrane receptor protein involved in Fe transport